ncbi:hypothetical protein WS90_07490 [Burkholderia cepacia]|uniref:Uncharacterized protein n=1 Tax=Burkholderia cepacia TaxID=292 RepID=A0A103ZU79_BURCE|nr:hypothetical protein WS90_07490 [Burkholderia cepacia]
MPIAVERALDAACEMNVLADACSTNTALELSARPARITGTWSDSVSSAPPIASAAAASPGARGPQCRARRPASGVTTTATRNTA